MWEAVEHAAFYELDNLTAIIDVNRLGQRGETMHGWDLRLVRRPAASVRLERDRDRRPRRRADRRRLPRGRVHDRQADRDRREDDQGQGLLEGREPGRLARQGARGRRGGDRGARRHPQHRRRRAEAGGRGAAPLRDRPAPSWPRTRSARRSRRARRTATRSPRSAASDGDVVALDGEVSNSTYAEIFRRGASRALLRDVHRRAADGRGRGRDAGARLEAVRLHVRRVPLARLRLRPHGARSAARR